MSKPLIFWDFDGVMADSTPFVFGYWQTALNKAGYDFELEDYQATFTRKFPFDYLLEKFPTAAHKIFADYSAYENAYYPQKVEPFDGFVPHFKSIAEGFDHAIVSANLETVIATWLKKHGLKDSFSAIQGRETPGHKDEKIRHILTQKNLPLDQTLFVGDTTSDINHAQSAGIRSVAVTWGVHPRAKLETANPTHVCDSVDELFILLNSLSLRG